MCCPCSMFEHEEGNFGYCVNTDKCMSLEKWQNEEFNKLQNYKKKISKIKLMKQDYFDEEQRRYNE